MNVEGAILTIILYLFVSYLMCCVFFMLVVDLITMLGAKCT
jgi:hypothetical protein